MAVLAPPPDVDIPHTPLHSAIADALPVCVQAGSLSHAIQALRASPRGHALSHVCDDMAHHVLHQRGPCLFIPPCVLLVSVFDALLYDLRVHLAHDFVCHQLALHGILDVVAALPQQRFGGHPLVPAQNICDHRLVPRRPFLALAIVGVLVLQRYAVNLDILVHDESVLSDCICGVV